MEVNPEYSVFGEEKRILMPHAGRRNKLVVSEKKLEDETDILAVES